ncbi:MAG: hypothetical protein Aureis2KO_03920 [Aureisphaera sp.]
MKNFTFKEAMGLKGLVSHGTYSVSNDTFEINTEIPKLNLADGLGNTYSLQYFKSYDISSSGVSCILSIFKHNHPTHRSVLNSESLIWDKQKGKLSDIIPPMNLCTTKILVINMHDEDFEELQLEKYRGFVDEKVTFDGQTSMFNYGCTELQQYLGTGTGSGTYNEEPRTCGGGVLDPI